MSGEALSSVHGTARYGINKFCGIPQTQLGAVTVHSIPTLCVCVCVYVCVCVSVCLCVCAIMALTSLALFYQSRSHEIRTLQYSAHLLVVFVKVDSG